MKIEERVWINLPLHDFMSNVSYVLAKANVGISGIIQTFNYEKGILENREKTESELKDMFIEKVNQSLKRSGYDFEFQDCKLIWNCYTIWIPIETGERE